MEELEYNKAVAELDKLYFELDNMQQEAQTHNQILLENGVKIAVGHTSKNLRFAPLSEMIQYDQQH